MEERATGIILRTRPFTETSLIVEWLTEEAGRVSTVAKGARRAKSPFVGKLDLFYAADFSFGRSRRSELHNLREVQLRKTHAELRQELAWVHQASYFALLIQQGTEAETPIPEIYALFASALDALPRSAPRARMVLSFEMKLLSLLGYEPDLSALTPEARGLAEQLLGREFVELGGLEASSRSIHHAVNRFVQIAIGTALERLPPQRERALDALLPKTTGPLQEH
jgi:DNA repair protein RecO (recombination protein O)